jgi:hypothetical protein
MHRYKMAKQVLWTVAVSGSRSLIVTCAKAPHGRTRHAAFHDFRIVLSAPQIQLATAVSRALHFENLAEVREECLRLKTGRKTMTLHRLQSFAIQAR